MKNVIAGFVFAALAIGCGGNSVDIVGKSPEQQADAIATALCEQEVECGNVIIDCSQTDGVFECTGTIEPAEFGACYEDLREDILGDLRDCDLTAAEEQIVEDCMNAMVELDCISQAELDAYVAELNAGNDPGALGSTPAACIQTAELFEGCSSSPE